jgi:NADPH:quinone reductase-like Zn-dependent oxidoreductase
MQLGRQHLVDSREAPSGDFREFGLNRSELKLRLGLSAGVSFPRVPGIEAAGAVDAAPAGSGLAPGQTPGANNLRDLCRPRKRSGCSVAGAAGQRITLLQADSVASRMSRQIASAA